MNRYIKSNAIVVMTLLISLSTQFANSQSITGRVADLTGKALPFVNVLLLNFKDSSVVKGAVTDTSGIYAVEKVLPGRYLLAASFVGYKITYHPDIFIEEGSMRNEIPLLKLSENTTQLNEVAITGQRPFIEQMIDRTVINVANSIIASGATALEVLEKAPGVTVDRQNDQVQLRGKEGVIIQINGKQTYLASQDVVSMLRGTASENIDKIELITNPSSKYDAAGNAGIINIVMKQNDKFGTNGILSISFGTGRYERGRASLQVNHRNQKVNLFGNYGYNYNGNYFDLHTIRQFYNEVQTTFAQQKSYIKTPELSHNAKAGLEYTLSKQTTIGLTWTGLWSTRNERGTASSAFQKTQDSEVFLFAQTEKALNSSLSNQVANINMQHRFKGKGGQLTADVDAGWFERDISHELVTETTNEGLSTVTGLITTMPTAIHLYTIKGDYSRSFNDGWKLELGVKRSHVVTESNLSIETGPLDNTNPDPSLANDFNYTESVDALYLNLFGKISNNIQFQAGLRSEHTNSVANSITTENVVSRDYLDFFPSLFITDAISKKHTLTFSYSRRIDRPNYQNLNQGRSYIDPYLYTEGNPYLRPQYTHSLEIKHALNSSIFTSIGASFTSELVTTFLEPVDSVQSVRTPFNIGGSQAYNATIAFPLTIIKNWSLQLTLMGIYGRFQYTYLEIPQTSEQLTARLNGTNSIILGKGWTAEVSGWINAPATNAMYHSPWLGSLDAGLQKSFNKKFKAKLTLQDVFHTNHVRSQIDATGFVRNTKLNFDTRVLLLNLIYSFGNEKVKSASQRKTGSEDELRRTN